MPRMTTSRAAATSAALTCEVSAYASCVEERAVKFVCRSRVMVDLIFNTLYTPSEWPDMAGQLYQIADFLYNGDNNNFTRRSLTPSRDFLGSSALPELTRALGTPRFKRSSSFIYPHNSPLAKRQWHNSTDEPETPPLYDYANQAITCSDSVDLTNYTTTDVFNVIVAASTNVSELFGPSFSWPGFWCHKWPARAVERYTGLWSTRLDEPVLLIGNKEDPITPMAGAVWVQENLASSAVLVEQDDFGVSLVEEKFDFCQGSLLKCTAFH